jgi:AcrR family transcriptional regulator
MAQPAETPETPVTRPLSRKRRQTQIRLLDAALETFAERGFHGTSVEEVCERAGFSRGAFYSNYSSKTELFIALYTRQAERTIAALVTHTPTELPANHDLEAVVSELVSAIPTDQRWYLINTEFALHAVRNPSAAAAFAAARISAREILAEKITEILAHIGRELTVPAKDFARWLFAINEGSVIQSYMEPGEMAPHEMTRLLAPLLLASVTRPTTE